MDSNAAEHAGLHDAENVDSNAAERAGLHEAENVDSNAAEHARLYEAEDVDSNAAKRAGLHEAEDVDSNAAEHAGLHDAEDVDSNAAERVDLHEAEDVVSNAAKHAGLHEAEDVDSNAAEHAGLHEAEDVDSNAAERAGLHEAENIDSNAAEHAGLHGAENADSNAAERAGWHEAEDVDSNAAEHAGLHEAEDVVSNAAEHAGWHEAEDVDSNAAEHAGLHEAEDMDSNAAKRAGLHEPEDVDSNAAEHAGLHEPEDVDSNAAEHAGRHEAEDVDSNAAERAGRHEAEDVDSNAAERAGLHEAEDVDSNAAERVGLARGRERRLKRSRACRLARGRGRRLKRSRACRQSVHEAEDVDSNAAERAGLHDAEDVDSNAAERAGLHEAEDVDSNAAERAGLHEAEDVDSNAAERAGLHEAEDVDSNAAERAGLHEAESAISEQEFAQAMQCFSFPPRPRLAVAVSGGADSLALSVLTRNWIAHRNGFLVGVIVDHHLRPESTREAQRTKQQLRQLHIRAHILDWQRTSTDKASQGAARQARYALYQVFLAREGIRDLLLGHHLQDQIETFFLRLVRGSGLVGLASIPTTRVIGRMRILRPLLHMSPLRLQATLRARNLSWTTDPSNHNPKYARVRVRRMLAGISTSTQRKAAHLVRILGHLRNHCDTQTQHTLQHITYLPRGGIRIIDLERWRRQSDCLRMRTLLYALLAVTNGPQPTLPPGRLRYVCQRLHEPNFQGKETLGGVLMQSSHNQRLLLTREWHKAARQPLPVGKRLVYDRRLEVEVANSAHKNPWINVLGENAPRPKTLRSLARAYRLPFAALPALVGIFDAQGLLSLPDVGYLRQDCKLHASVWNWLSHRHPKESGFAGL